MNYTFEAVSIICVILFCTMISGTNSIINGREPELNEVRYMVGIVGATMCSGGIIGNKHVITAAHCVPIDENNKLRQIAVLAAINNLKEYDPNVSIGKYVKRAFVLDAYAKSKSLHDIAVLGNSLVSRNIEIEIIRIDLTLYESSYQLSESLQIEENSDKLQILDLPTPTQSSPPTYPSYEDVFFKAAGYGASKYKLVEGKDGVKRPETFADGRLLVANAIILRTRYCKKIYRSKMENRMCMAVIEDLENDSLLGFCKGDGGTPIVVNNTIVVGVMSAGNCNKTYTPSIGVRTTAFIPFIENAMNGIVTPDMKVYDV